MVIGTKELGGLLFQGEKIKIEKTWEVVGWVLGQVIHKIYIVLISNLHYKYTKSMVYINNVKIL